jgi:PAS domain S-box-containing protein
LRAEPECAKLTAAPFARRARPKPPADRPAGARNGGPSPLPSRSGSLDVIKARSNLDFHATRGLRAALIALLVLLLAVLWSGLFYHLSSQRRLELDHAARDVQNLTRVYGEQIHSTFSAVDQTLLLLKHIRELRDIEFNPAFALADNLLLKGADLRVRIIGADGYSVYSSDPHAFVGDREYFRAHVERDTGRMFIGRPEYTEPNGEPLIDLSRRLDRPDGSFDGVVVISFDPRSLVPSLASIGAGPTTFMGVVGLDHVIVVVPEALPTVFGRLGEALNAPRLFAELARSPAGALAARSVTDGVDRITAWQQLDDYPLFVAAARDQEPVLADFNRHRIALIAATAVISCLFALAGGLLLRTLEQRAALAASVAHSRAQLLEAQRMGKIGHFVVDDAAGTVNYSDECFPMMGRVPEADIPVAHALSIIHRDDLPRYLALRNGDGGELEARVVRPDGSICWIHMQLRPRIDGAGNRVGLFGVVQDITARKQAEETVHQQERQLRAIMDNAPVAIFLKDRDGRYLIVNQQLVDSLGIPADQLIGRTDAEVLPDLAVLSEPSNEMVLKHGQIARVERPASRGRPGLEHVEILKFPIFAEDGSIAGLSGFTFNVTERRRIEEQLRQAAKMEAVGRLAGGIAHDFNNMIGAITGFNSFLIEDLDPATPEHQFATRIAQVCRSAKHLVEQVLAFARAGQVEKRTIDLRAAVAEDAPLFKAALPPSTHLAVDVGAVALPVVINEGQVNQVLLNLCVNASDALGGRPGQVAVRLEPVGAGHPDHRRLVDEHGEPGAARARGGRLDADRAYCAIRVSDTGCGMDQATLDRVFEPFYSTKPPGRGTGLGLAVIHGIVTACDGAYLVTSRLGGGAEFAIYLPLAGPPTPSRDTDDAPPGPASLLVVDDEINITDMLAIGLERFGYEVTCCNDPAEALHAFEQDPGAWDIVITDQTMPGLTGAALIARIKAIRPDCPTILLTGFSDRAAAQAVARGAGADGWLVKPIEPRHVADKVRELLDRSAAALRGTVGAA